MYNRPPDILFPTISALDMSCAKVNTTDSAGQHLKKLKKKLQLSSLCSKVVACGHCLVILPVTIIKTLKMALITACLVS